MKGKNIGFVSTRFAGIDGVSLEASKWSEVFEQNGHNCFWFAGELDRNPEKSFLEPKAHFHHAQNQWINSQIILEEKCSWMKTGKRSKRRTRRILSATPPPLIC